MTDKIPPVPVAVVYPVMTTPAKWMWIGLQLGILAVAVTVLVLSFLMKTVGDELVVLPGAEFPMPQSCTWRMLFGVDCPGCGLTRALIAISAGQWWKAWNLNPASFVVYLFIAVQVPWRLYQLGRLWRGQRPWFSPWLLLPLLVVLLALVTQWLFRIW